jgi:hypothetical protein
MVLETIPKNAGNDYLIELKFYRNSDIFLTVDFVHRANPEPTATNETITLFHKLLE